MDARCRLVLLQFLCLVWPSPPYVTVDSFVLRRRSTVDDDQRLADALFDVERFDDLDDVDQYGIPLPQGVEDYETDVPDDYDDDDEAAEKLRDIINQEREQEAAEQYYEDFGVGDYLDNGGETWADREDLDRISDDDGDEKEVDSPTVKMPLDKTQVKEMLSETSEQPVEHEVEKKTTQLSKNDVERLFDNAVTSDDAEVDTDDELEENTSELDMSVPSTDVDEITKTIEDLKSDDSGDVGDKVIDVKEEVVSPVDGKKLSKEWITEIIQGEDDGSSQSSGGRKSKRSMDDDEFETEAKQRAVDLLKTYIELQEEENRHLTKALNLATLAQTQRTDRYIDDEVQHLRRAVGDEAAIETLRDMIRADEGVDEEDELEEQEEEELGDEDQDQEEAEEFGNNDDYVPVKREDQLSKLFTPHDRGLDNFDEDDREDYEKNMFLQERLRQYLLKTELDDIRNQMYSEDLELNPFTRSIEEVGGVYDKRYDRGNVYGEDGRDNGFLRDLETAAAVAKLRDAMQASTAEEDAGVCPAVYYLTDDCLAATQRRLTLDDEATQLCNRHQLCYTCGAEFGLAAAVCDEGYLRETDRVCSRQSVSGEGFGRCRGEAAGLFVIMSQEHRYYPPDTTPDACRQRCAYDFIVSSR